MWGEACLAPTAESRVESHFLPQIFVHERLELRAVTRRIVAPDGCGEGGDQRVGGLWGGGEKLMVGRQNV